MKYQKTIEIFNALDKSIHKMYNSTYEYFITENQFKQLLEVYITENSGVYPNNTVCLLDNENNQYYFSTNGFINKKDKIIYRNYIIKKIQNQVHHKTLIDLKEHECLAVANIIDHNKKWKLISNQDHIKIFDIKECGKGTSLIQIDTRKQFEFEPRPRFRYYKNFYREDLSEEKIKEIKLYLNSIQIKL